MLGETGTIAYMRAIQYWNVRHMAMLSADLVHWTTEIDRGAESIAYMLNAHRPLDAPELTSEDPEVGGRSTRNQYEDLLQACRRVSSEQCKLMQLVQKAIRVKMQVARDPTHDEDALWQLSDDLWYRVDEVYYGIEGLIRVLGPPYWAPDASDRFPETTQGDGDISHFVFLEVSWRLNRLYGSYEVCWEKIGSCLEIIFRLTGHTDWIESCWLGRSVDDGVEEMPAVLAVTDSQRVDEEDDNGDEEGPSILA